MNESVLVRVYARDGCHLCEEALTEIHSLAQEGAVLELEVVDIESDDRLLTRFLEKIPVVEVNGRIASELTFDRDSFIKTLGSTGGTSAGYPE